MRILEYFAPIGQFSGMKVFDTKHFKVEFQRWFPELSEKDYMNALYYGMKEIKSKYGFVMNNFMIISKSKGFRIPLEIREDRKKKDVMIGLVATCLNAKEVKNLRNEVEIFVEGNKNTYSKFPITEGFNYYTQHGKIFTDYEEIEVE